jgi:hypothetical protein
MKEWPTEITAHVLEVNAKVSDERIRIDIRDTEIEIRNYERLRVAELDIADAHPDENERKMAAFKASARPGMIAERQAFVDFLNRILAAREAVTLNSEGVQT